MAAQALAPIDVLMVGTGEYTTGYGKESSKSDKNAGVVALCMFDLRSRGMVGRLGLCGTNGRKLPAIRDHMAKNIGEAYPRSEYDLACDTFPADDAVDPAAYREALASFPAGSAVTIFTPDDTHFQIALDCIEAGMHVLITKPPVKTLEDHRRLVEAAQRKGVLVAVEVHKRWDPMYVDARDRIRGGAIGDISYMNAYMSQPKRQLETFRAWAGKSSDISYYLNSHHIDFAEWALHSLARPVRVTAMAATGVAQERLGRPCEDTITLTVQWENKGDEDQQGTAAAAAAAAAGAAGRTVGVGVYTSSWVAPPSDVHSQQRFFFLGQRGQVNVDQAHRGYTCDTDASGHASCNPLFMKYAPTAGRFSGQTGYGYRSFEAFVRAAQAVNAGQAAPGDFSQDGSLPTIDTTMQTTAVLEAGRRSLDNGGRAVDIVYEDTEAASFSVQPVRIEVQGGEA